MYIYPNKNFIQIFNFSQNFWEGSSPADLMDESALCVIKQFLD
jgi:hypothetical protein